MSLAPYQSASSAERYAARIVELPDPREADAEFVAGDLPHRCRVILPKLIRRNALVDCGWASAPGEEKRWRVKEQVFDDAEQAVENTPFLPNCEHPAVGFRNLGDGAFACSVCDEVYARDVIEEVFG